jgi:hypothetical protein
LKNENLTTHQVLVDLSTNKDSFLKLVTTNFDNCFNRVIDNSKTFIYHAPGRIFTCDDR